MKFPHRLLPLLFVLCSCTSTRADTQLPIDDGLLRVHDNGRIDIVRDCGTVTIASSFSFPGATIGHNRLGDGETTWRPRVGRINATTVGVRARGEWYELDRRIERRDTHIRVIDRLTSIASRDVGVRVTHQLTASTPVREVRLCGVPQKADSRADNPTVFMALDQGGIGVVAEDNVLRAQFTASTDQTLASFGTHHLGLPPGESVTFEWSIYPTDDGDYFSFINRVRDDWGVNYTIDGPGAWFLNDVEPYMSLSHDSEALAAFLERKRQNIILVNPWLEWDHMNMDTGLLTTRDEYKRMFQAFRARVKAIDPDIAIVGCIEAPFVTLPQELADSLTEQLGNPPHGTYHELSPDMVETFRAHEQAWRRWGDSMAYSRDDRPQVLYVSRTSRQRGQRNIMGLVTRAIVGNGQHDFLMNQARFVIEDVGLDGFYLDSLMGARHPVWGYSHDQWDGVTVDIDPSTGEITHRYTDLALAAATSRREVIRFGLDRGKTVVVNGHPIDRETQSLPAIYFNEAAFVFKAMDTSITPDELDQWFAGKPTLHARPCEAHLSSPVVLGFNPLRIGDLGRERYAQIITRGAIAFLRHGLLYFHYDDANSVIPESGPGSGSYGPINHMFPITPVRLGEGFVEGHERIVTCVSRRFEWSSERKPNVLLFDIDGRPMHHVMRPVRSATGWTVAIELNDWQNIAVVE